MLQLEIGLGIWNCDLRGVVRHVLCKDVWFSLRTCFAALRLEFLLFIYRFGSQHMLEIGSFPKDAGLLFFVFCRSDALIRYRARKREEEIWGASMEEQKNVERVFRL